MALCIHTKVSAGQGHAEEAVLRLGLLGYPRQDMEWILEGPGEDVDCTKVLKRSSSSSWVTTV